MRRYNKILLTAFILTAPLTVPCFGGLPEIEVEEVVRQGINIDLREPVYTDGVLSTESGGVICAPELRIQATHIVYTRKTVEEVKVETIEAEGELMIEFGDYVFVGERLEYNLQNDTGIIYCGRTSVEPWFFGGDTILLHADKSITVNNGFITTSEGVEPDWVIESDSSELCGRRYLTANNVHVKVLKVPFFWLPKLKMDLNTIFDSPVRYECRFGGQQGPVARMIYEVFSWERWKTYLRMEYRVKFGAGAGIETYYSSKDHRERFETISYIAQDTPIEGPHIKVRYRFEGIYRNRLNDDRTTINLCYDKLSDKDMAEDYNDTTLDIPEAGRTELHVRHQEDNSITNFFTRVRINSFQTIKQEIPNLTWRARPLDLGRTGIISDTYLQGGYLDYDYATDIIDVHDYSSTRFCIRQQFYRPFSYAGVTATPEAGFVGIHYGNSPHKTSEDVVTGLFGCRLNTHFYRQFSNWKHVVQPYLNYQYYTYPNTAPNDHFIFDIDDGWYRLNMLRFGVENNFYFKEIAGCCIHRFLRVDLYGNAFFHTKTLPKVFPKVYADISFNSFTYLRHTVNSCWNIQENELDYCNIRTDWTITHDLAMALEYRHRGPYDWRKVNHNNFILDSFRPIPELLDSQLSDRRDTLLLHSFFRFHPLWAIEYQVRHGWNRRFEPHYTEYQVDLHTNLGSAWKLKVSYQYREDDHRIAFYFTLGAQRPSGIPCTPIPCIEF